jgi:hypothetical protein
MGFEPTVKASARAKTVHALDRSATVTGDITDAINKNTETLFDASKGVGLEVNTEKTKYMLLYRHQNEEQKS